jgi:translation initiation factor IF-2
MTNIVGRAEVIQIFRLDNGATIASCKILEGLVRINSLTRISRQSTLLTQSRVTILRRFRDNVLEVKAEKECGISFEGFNDLQCGDRLEFLEGS